MHKHYEIEKKYEQFCKQENIPLFMQAWWLDIVAHGKWSAVVVENRSGIIAAMPFLYGRKFGLRFIYQSEFTPHLGPWLTSEFDNSKKALSQKKNALDKLINQLPQFHIYNQHWHPSIKYWLPFYWSGFQQTTRYTYRILKLGDLEFLWSSLHENIRREIRKAKNRYKITLDHTATVDDFLPLAEMTFRRQGKKLPFSPDYLREIDKKLETRNCRKIFLARDEEGRPHSGLYLVWDKQSAYYLIGGSDPELRNSGAMSFCLWEAICFSAEVTEVFDFEGSMIEEIERYFRSFGAELTPYFAVTKTSSIFTEILLMILKRSEALKRIAQKTIRRA